MKAKYEIERVPLPTLIELLQDNRYNNKQISLKVGVTPLQIHYYKIGRTREPSPIVVMKLLTKFEVNGKHLLADIYKDFEELDRHYNIVMEQINGVRTTNSEEDN